MPPFKTLLAASLLLISFMSGAASAGLYSSDTNNFFTLKTKLTDARQYRYAALVSAGDIGGDNFETLHRLARIYADILEKDMGVHVKLYETDALKLKNSNNFMTSAIEQIQRKNFSATADTCAVASTFLYPSTVSNLLRIMAPDLLVARNDPALYAKIVDLSKDTLAQELGVLMKMCDVSASRKQTAAFKQFLEALHGEQSYIVSSARVSQGSERAIAASAAEDAEREEISKKALARNAERDKAYQDAEDARDAKIIADRAAELAENKRMAQRQEDARQQALAARPPANEPKQEPEYRRPFDIPKAMKFASCSAFFTAMGQVIESHGQPANSATTDGAIVMAIASIVYSNADYLLNNTQPWVDKYVAEINANLSNSDALLKPIEQNCFASYRENLAEIKIYNDEARAEFFAKSDSLVRGLGSN
ncbi:MAG: hypothetical protein K2Y25_11615 [Pseudomonadaceae bacterium]|nr:hypothetical protein [Pseudomonadaceae bacterium]